MTELARIARLLRKDLIRWALMALLASVILFASVPLAQALEQPGVAVAGMWTAMSLYGAGFVPVLRRLLLDYVDLRIVYLEAMKSDPGRVFVGVCVVIAALILSLAGGRAQAQEIPRNALEHLPTLSDEIAAHWPTAPDWALFAGQVEQESCISLKHPRCWNPRSELSTSREQGVGFGQITRVFGRFDALAEMRAQFPTQLAGWAWDRPSLYDPAYQLRALVLKDRHNWQTLGDVPGADRMTMALVAYNGGLGGLASDRRVCQATPGCDHRRWWGHVEHTSLKSRVVANGYGKSFFDINREYPVMISKRADKYRQVMS